MWFVGELHRISVCYGPGRGDEDAFTFSDDQSSCQVSLAPPLSQGEDGPRTLCCVCRTTAARTGRSLRTLSILRLLPPNAPAGSECKHVPVGPAGAQQLPLKGLSVSGPASSSWTRCEDQPGPPW